MSACEEYEELRDELDLPPLEELEETFDFSLDEDSDDPLKDVKEAMDKTVSRSREVLGSILFVSKGSAPHNIFESHVLDDRGEYLELYKQLQEVKWLSLRAAFDPTEENLADCINECHDGWTRDFQEELVRLTEIMEEAWEEYEEGDADMSYLG